MVQKISSIAEFDAHLKEDSCGCIFILHRANSAFYILINDMIERIEEKENGKLRAFCFVDILNPKMQPLIHLYRLKEIPAVLFFEQGQLINKLEGTITKSEFETALQSISNNNSATMY